MEIKPTYVSLEQAKKLKEKGFNEPCDSIFNKDGEFQSYKNVGDIRTHFKNNEPINPKTWHRYDTSAPEQWQVVEWLRVNHGIWINVEADSYGELWYSKLCVCSKKVWENLEVRSKIINSYRHLGEHNSPQEAYSSAFDYILKELI